jgi:mono/diheme cytochrome c family protein
MKRNDLRTTFTACLAAAASITMANIAHAQQAAHFPAGESLFGAHCAVCHQAGGKGQDGLAPPLTEYPGKYATLAQGRVQLTATLVHGMFGEIKVHDKSYNFKMPSFAKLSDEDLAQVLNYVVFDLNLSHGGEKGFTAAEIHTTRAQSLDPAAVHTQRAALTKELGL